MANVAAAQTTILLTERDAACIAKYVDTYLEAGNEPVVIVPPDCPEIPTTNDLMAALSLQNSADSLPEPKIGKPDAAIVLLRAELKCFARLFASGVVAKSDNGLISVSLDQCAQ